MLALCPFFGSLRVMYCGNLQTRGWPGRQGQKKFDESGENGKLFTIHNLGAEITISHFRGIQSPPKNPWVPLGWLLSLMMGVAGRQGVSWIHLLFATKHSKYFSEAKALFAGCSRAAHWSKRQACKRPPERTGSLEEHWAPKHELFLKYSSGWSLGRRGQQAGRQAEVGIYLPAEREMFIQSKLKCGQRTNHGVGLL